LKEACSLAKGGPLGRAASSTSRSETTGCAATSASTSGTNRSCGELCVGEREERGGGERHSVDRAVRDGAFRDEDL
jgi:hypothetical protein